MTGDTIPEERQPTVEPLDAVVDHVRGPAAGRLILEYGDYECPYSRLAFREIESVEQQVSGGIRFAFRHFPLVEIHPHLRDIELTNFKVRILDEAKGTGAITRVLLDSSDGSDTWGSIGVSENIIEASWEALVDSLEAGMLPSRAEHTRRGGVGDPAR